MSTITITKGVLTVGATNYQIRNINFTEKYLFKPVYSVGIGTILMLLIYVVPVAIISLLISAYTTYIQGFYLLFWIVIPALGILERFTKTNTYGLSIQTNAGNVRLIVSKDENQIDAVNNGLAEVMNDGSFSGSQTFNIASGDIINQQGNFETGVKIG